MLLVAIAPEGWAAMAVLVAVAVAAQRRADREPDVPMPARNRWLRALALLIIIPVGLLIAATQMGDPHEAGLRDMDAVCYSLIGIVLMQLALGSALIWRYRQRWLPTVLIAGGICWWSVGAALIAYLALTANWI
jgi:hypothetical protein